MPPTDAITVAVMLELPLAAAEFAAGSLVIMPQSISTAALPVPMMPVLAGLLSSAIRQYWSCPGTLPAVAVAVIGGVEPKKLLKVRLRETVSVTLTGKVTLLTVSSASRTTGPRVVPFVQVTAPVPVMGMPVC